MAVPLSPPAPGSSHRSRTIPARLERAASAGEGITFFEGGGARTEISWAQLLDESRATAAALQAKGVCPGDHVCILGPTSRPLVTAIQATWLAGACAVMLPLPLRLGSVEDFVVQTKARMRNADAKLVLADPDLAPFIDTNGGQTAAVLLDEIEPVSRARGSGRFEEPDIDPASLAILQYTSGSTADPKGVMLPHAQVTANIDAITEASGLRGSDRIVSWLPLYHDMGLIGLMGVPMLTGIALGLAGPQDFMASPTRWMEWMSEFRATATGGPNFAYALAARGMPRQSGLDLSAWRLALNGAEPIDPAAVEVFCDNGKRHGFDASAIYCVYGMAEVTLAISFPEPGTGMSTDSVDRHALESEGLAARVDRGDPRGRLLARVGYALPGLELRVVDPGVAGTADQAALDEREVGEIQVRGDSVMAGYYKNVSATEEVLRDGWLSTGDLGYIADGELVVCGRAKDMIIVGGRNVFPEDVERAVAGVSGVRPGNVIAFGVEGRKGRDALVVVAETRIEDSHIEIRRAVAERVRRAVGLGLEEVVLVGPGSLPKTSSGKLQRSLCRRRYLSSELEPV